MRNPCKEWKFIIVLIVFSYSYLALNVAASTIEREFREDGVGATISSPDSVVNLYNDQEQLQQVNRGSWNERQLERILLRRDDNNTPLTIYISAFITGGGEPPASFLLEKLLVIRLILL
ncbi:MAG: hypothetical protein Q8Q56_05025 [Alphaproteobacteria bacterium]|nr:hypothetical protein [Alphaproteobacteria bacterium]